MNCQEEEKSQAARYMVALNHTEQWVGLWGADTNSELKKKT